jgi:2-methylcitrate dehydratase PrpD
MGSKELANFATDTDFRNIPEEAITLARRAILDYLGVAIAGSNETAATILCNYVKQISSVSEAGVIGKGFRTSAELAAWTNGTIGHALDYDDTDSIAAGYNMHPSVPIFPAVLALGEKCRASGKEILTAYIVGFEVESRLGLAIGAESSESGWHPTSVLGTIAAAVACAKILELKTIETQMALGIAASLAGGLMSNFGTNTKPMHAGNAAKNGLIAAVLAKKGFTANEDIMDGEFGFCSLFSKGKIFGLPDKLDLGGAWNIITIGFALKPYPSCRDTHGCVDAVLQLRKEFNIAPDQVEVLVCNVSPRQARSLKFSRPRNGYEARFSMPYCVGRALLKGQLTLDDFKDEMIADSAVQNLMPKINLVHSKGCEGESDSAQEVFIKLRNGREYSYKITEPKGDPKNPMTDEELLAKFRDCAKLTLKADEIEKTIKLILGIEELKNVTELTEIITNLA